MSVHSIDSVGRDRDGGILMSIVVVERESQSQAVDLIGAEVF